MPWLFLLLMILLVPLCAHAQTDPERAYQSALTLARAGQHERALPMLRELAESYPDKPEYRYDYITVLGWADKDAEVLAQLPRVDIQESPVYVLNTFGRAALNVGDNKKAIEFYRMSLNKEPNDSDSLVGLSSSLIQAGDTPAASKLLEKYLQRYPNDIEALSSLASAYEESGQFLDAISIQDQILHTNPDDHEAIRQRILLTAKLGAAPQALALARQHPGLFTDDEVDSLTIDTASKYINWAGLYHPVPAERYEDTDKAIMMLDGVLDRQEGRQRANQSLQIRARSDLIVALVNRNRPSEAITLYEAMETEEVNIPDYARKSAGDAYASTQNPEKARDIYLELLQRSPDDFDLRIALFYVYFDLNEQERAYEIIDELAAKQTDPDQRLRAESSAALARAWSDNLAEAQLRYEGLTRAAPNNPHLQAELGYIYLWRGWPRRAEEQFRISSTIEPEVLSSRIGEIETDRARNNFVAAGQKIGAALQQYPDDVQIDKLSRSWEVHNMRELWVQASTTRSTGNQEGSRDLDLETYLYSQPWRSSYRVFAHGYLAQSKFPEGKATYRRLGAGLEYRARDVELSGELSNGFGRDEGLGLGLRGNWLYDDHWRFGLRYDSYSNELPLRGRLNDDIDGWMFGGDVEYRVSESRSFAADIQFLDFSDGNQRTSATASAMQRLINRPKYKLDGRLAVYKSRNSEDQINVSYFNPSSDFSLEATAINEWLHSRFFLHRLGLSLGMYKQSDYDAEPITSAYYEHDWRPQDRFSLIYGVSLSRPVYDGESETHTRLYLNLRWRF